MGLPRRGFYKLNAQTSAARFFLRGGLHALVRHAAKLRFRSSLPDIPRENHADKTASLGEIAYLHVIDLKAEQYDSLHTSSVPILIVGIPSSPTFESTSKSTAIV